MKRSAAESAEVPVELWIEICQERDTLHQALDELGWQSSVPVGSRLRVELRFAVEGA